MITRSPWVRSFVLASALAFAGGCAMPAAPRVRVATATQAELEAVRDADTVWYEFQEGDEVPIQLAFFGAMQGAGEHAIVVRAKQRFYFIMSKYAPMRLSFDGETVAGSQASQTLVGVSAREDGKGGVLGWMVYMGTSQDPEGELKKLIESAPPPNAPAGDGAEPSESEASGPTASLPAQR